jgi:hypothetical protein
LSIRRAIVCWHTFLSSGSSHWLKEADRKLDLSRWIERNRKRLAHGS